VFIAGLTVLFAAAGVAQTGSVSGLIGAAAVMSIFWLIGAGMLLAGWNMGLREAAVAVADGKLFVMQTGLRRAKRHEWPLDEVTSIRVGPSGMEVNDVPVLELQIHGPKAKLFGMLAGRDPRELTWMATLLRQAIKQPRAANVAGDSSATSAAAIEP
jgi:hypothetical protein